jgi:hypothetical protein
MVARIRRPAVPKLPKIKMPRVKMISGYVKQDGTYVAPYLRSK